MLRNEREYWIQLMSRLNSSQNLYAQFQEVLLELCEYFGFGAGFIYETDHRGSFHLKCTAALYPCELPPVVDQSVDFFEEDAEAVRQQKVIAFRAHSQKTPVEEKLAALTGAKSMIFVPILDQDDQLVAAVGVMDRRGAARTCDDDTNFTAAVLTTLGAYIKMQMYQNRALTAKLSLERILNNMGVDVYVNDYETHEILYLNESMAAPYGNVDGMLGSICWKALYDDKTGECDFCPKQHLIDEEGNPTKIYSWDYMRPFDGSWFRVLSGAFPWVDGRLAQVISSVDITENKRNEEIIRQMAEKDMLTNLPNRLRMTNDCESRFPLLRENGEEAFVVFFDLDGFKSINDNHGHVVGDEFLSEVGAFLLSNPMTRSRCYRYGGDEFVILWDASAPCTLLELIQSVKQRFEQTWRLKEQEVDCGLSIGVSHFPHDDVSPFTLIRFADQAMYHSKTERKCNVYFYNGGDVCRLEDYPLLPK